MMKHLQRHVIGYATVLGAMLGSIGERLADPSPLGRRAIAEMAVAALATGCATITAYRSQSGKNDSNEKAPTPPTPPPSPA